MEENLSLLYMPLEIDVQKTDVQKETLVLSRKKQLKKLIEMGAANAAIEKQEHLIEEAENLP